jgi:hypothetical protein
VTTIAPPATQFYLLEWTPFWLDLDPRCKDIAEGLRTVGTHTWTVHDMIFQVGRLLDQAVEVNFRCTTRPPDTTEIALVDGDPLRFADAWLESTKQAAFTAVSRCLKEHPPSVAKIQEMRSKITKVNGGRFRMVQVLFIGLRKNSSAAVFGAMMDGSFVIRELGRLVPPPGSGLTLDRSQSDYKAEVVFWSDAELMQLVDSFTHAGFELIGTPMVILCPEVPSEWDDRVRWAERFVDDGLGMYVTGSMS